MPENVARGVPLVKQWYENIKGVLKYKALAHVSGEVAYHRAEKCATCPHLQMFAMRDFRGFVGFVIKSLYDAPMLGVCGICECPVMAEPNEGLGTVNFTVKGKAFSLVPCGKTETQDETCPIGRF